jgi:hypothetical protein
MPTTDFIPFATAPGANVQDQAGYAASGPVATGFTSGIAQSAPINKSIRQPTFGVAALFNWVIGKSGQNQPDDGNLTYAVANINSAINAAIAGQNGHFFTFAGNPNGSVAGTAGVAGVSPPDICEDTTTGHLWVCTTTGSTSTAVWSLGAAAGVTLVTAGTGLTGGNITSTGTIALGTATTSVLGGVKVDGSSITISSGVISSTNAGGSLNPSGNITVNDFAAWATSTTLKDVAAATAAQIRTGTDNLSPITSLGEVLAAAFQTLTDAATTAWNMASGFNARWTLGGNRTLGTPTNPLDGITYSLLVIQPATGGPCTVTWPASFKWGSTGAPTLSTGANVIDRVYLQYDVASTSFLASFVQGA